MALKRFFRWMVVPIALGLLLASPAWPVRRGATLVATVGSGQATADWKAKKNSYGHRKHYGKKHASKTSDSCHAPELDPGLFGSAAVLLVGGTLMLHGRRRFDLERIWLRTPRKERSPPKTGARPVDRPLAVAER